MTINRPVEAIILFVLFVLFLVSCDASETKSSITPPQTTNSVPDSEENPAQQLGKASLKGVLRSYTVHKDLPETLFYLALGVGENNEIFPPILVGPREEIGDIIGVTDSEGKIELNNIPPGKYYIIVWAPPYNWEPVIVSPENTLALLFDLQADERLTFDTLFVSWP